jgi:hypothetical protein
MSEILPLYKDLEWIKYQHDVLGKTYAGIAREQSVSWETIRYYRRKDDPTYIAQCKERGIKHHNINKERRNKENKQKYKDLQTKIFYILSPICTSCGITNIRFLTLDHIHNDGAKDRNGAKSNVGILRNLYKLGWPEDYIKENYQILCWNCNCVKGLRGYFDIPDKDLTYDQRYQIKLWKEAFAFLGPCSCGQSELKFLTISHIHNDGPKRAKNGEPRGGSQLLTKFRKLGWPESLKEDFCLECFNCNCGRKLNIE